MQTALVTAPLASTPPQHTPTRGLRRGSGGGIVAFRGPTEEQASSVPRSGTSYIDADSWRSGAARSANAPSPVVVTGAPKAIPTCESFIKVEGFQTKEDTPRSSPPASPGVGRAPSLLSRQLSADNLGLLHRPLPAVSGPAAAAALAQQLEAQCAIEPRVRPASLPRRPPIPDGLLPQLQARFAVFHDPLVVRAFNISRLAHDGREGPHGEPAFSRCVGAATILAELKADGEAVAGALLHDALDRTMLLEGQLRPMLGSNETVDLVKKVSHLGYICQKYRSATNTLAAEPGSGTAAHMVNLLVAHGPPRALLVRLAVALHSARSLDARPAAPVSPSAHAAERRRAAVEAIDVWAPLANRLGIWAFKAEMEDRAFRSLHPAEYAELRDRLERVQAPTQLVALVDVLRAQLQTSGVEYLDLSGRPKHLWGVFRKMQTKGYSAANVKDVRGLRIIVQSREDCYRALRAVETTWRIVGTPKNYIKNPKPNGYQSLHVVADPGDGHLVEIQIRTDKMHYLAEYGEEAAHWKYKEKTRGSPEGSVGNGAAREANWAKFVTSQHVARDKKFRPSGTPSRDKSLAGILASMDEVQSTSPESGSPGSKGRTFHEYIAATGQRPAPPEEVRALVAVVAGGNFSVAELEPGTTVAQLLRSCGEFMPHH